MFNSVFSFTCVALVVCLGETKRTPPVAVILYFLEVVHACMHVYFLSYCMPAACMRILPQQTRTENKKQRKEQDTNKTVLRDLNKATKHQFVNKVFKKPHLFFWPLQSAKRETLFFLAIPLHHLLPRRVSVLELKVPHFLAFANKPFFFIPSCATATHKQNPKTTFTIIQHQTANTVLLRGPIAAQTKQNPK